MLGELYLSLSL